MAAHDRPLVDATGAHHAPCPGSPRIVSLVPSITELLFEIGLGERVVGRTTFCVHPREQVASVARVGGTKKPRIDRLLALAPTHVIVNVDENRREDVQAIAAGGPRVIVTHPLGPDDNPALYRLLGGIFRCEPAAAALCERFARARASLRERAARLPRRRVLYLVWRAPYMTVSRDTYIARMLALVNWHTVPAEADARYPVIALTPALARDTDLVLLPSEPFPFGDGHADEVRAADGWAAHPVALVDGEMTSWYGSRAVAGLDYLGRLAGRLGGARA